MNTPLAPVTTPRPGSARAALATRDFRWMWYANLASSSGTWMQNVVLPAYIYERTHRASLVGVFIFAQLGPLLLLSIPGGVLADRFDRRRWLISSQVIQLTFSIFLGVCAAADSRIALLFLMQFGVGIGGALNAPTWSAVLPTLVKPEDLPGAISLNSTVVNGSRIVAPIIVAILSVYGVTPAQFFFINALTYLIVIFALTKITIPKLTKPPATGWSSFTFGIRFVRDHPVSRRILLSMMSFSFLSLTYVGLFPAVSQLNFGIAAKSVLYKWLYATWGLGACLGGLAVGTVFVGSDQRMLVRRGFACFSIALGIFAVVRTPVPAFIVAFFLGTAYFFTATSLLSVLQSRLESEVRGRVMALWFMAFGGTVPLGNMVFGRVIDAYGARWVLLAGAVWAMFLSWWCNIERVDELANEGLHNTL